MRGFWKFCRLGCYSLLILVQGQGCSDRLKTPPQNFEALREGIPNAEWFDITYTYTDSARLKARLLAPYVVERTKWRDKIELPIQYFEKGFDLVFFDALGDTQSVVTANSGEFNRIDGEAVARGNVVVTSVKKEMLQTEELYWYQKEDKIRTDKPVTITTATEVLYGVGLESNTSFTEYTIFQLKGTVQLKDEPVAAPAGTE